jgi:hypothetical protein
MILNFSQFLNEGKVAARGYFGPDGIEYYVEKDGRFYIVVAKADGGPASEAWDDHFANLDDAIEVAKGLADGTLHESYEPLNEDYAQQAAINQERIQKTMERVQQSKEKMNQLQLSTQSYKEKSTKTKDDISKAVYEAKIASNNARKDAYANYAVYLQSMVTFYQTKATEIEMRMKAAEKRKL